MFCIFADCRTDVNACSVHTQEEFGLRTWWHPGISTDLGDELFSLRTSAYLQIRAAGRSIPGDMLRKVVSGYHVLASPWVMCPDNGLGLE
jgi:hypothetical protein